MRFEIESFSRGSSIQGLPPTVFRLTNLEPSCLDPRGENERSILEERDWQYLKFYLDKILKIPIIKQVRILLPQDMKDKIKEDVKRILKNETIENNFPEP